MGLARSLLLGTIEEQVLGKWNFSLGVGTLRQPLPLDTLWVPWWWNPLPLGGLSAQ